MPDSVQHARSPKQARSRESFERVIEATLSLLGERSYEQLTLAEISQRAEASIGSIYGRVKGKEELLRAAQVIFFERSAEEYGALIEQIRSGPPELALVVPALVKGLGERLRQNAGPLRAFMNRAPLDPVIQAAGKAFYAQHHGALIRLVVDLKDQIAHPEPERAAEAALATVFAAQARYLGLDSAAPSGEGDWTQILDDLADMMLAFLLFTPRRAKPTRRTRK
ncbi:TetR/AcrR family transcriptional regulator [Pelomonas sp. KK5]|uniref:TetR/AcrR family transcriptional regulator n=1 Tax=Pelomonas sp. KK5 TaxID=1855730 RepID=UPI00097C1A84|nr:TetR/AcrR family transcriptional regulator [Pelomonas sp. KK5]